MDHLNCANVELPTNTNCMFGQFFQSAIFQLNVRIKLIYEGDSEQTPLA